MSPLTGFAPQLSTGLIGDRQLIAVQTFAIARLTSDPVALIPGTFIAVTGRGPVDSNESGKTSFLAAVSLLLGDPEWQITGNGTPNTTSLLFEPVIAGASTQLVDPAERGYIAGVFAAPDGTHPHTVWLQISSDSPYVQVRHQAGAHLLTDGDDNERHRAAPGFYKQLGTETLGAVEYAHRLYGRSPKVLAYVASRGQVRSRPSLLKLEAGTYSPDRIGDALITLSGRSSVLELDRAQRTDLADKRAEYAAALERHEKRLAREESLLREVEDRADLRDKIRSAEADRRAALARTLLDETARLFSAHQLLPQTRRTLQETADLLGELTAQRQTAANVADLERDCRTSAEAKEQRRTGWSEAQGDERFLAGRLTQDRKELEEARTLSADHTGANSRELRDHLTRLAHRTRQAEINRGISERDAEHYAEQLRAAELGHAGAAGAVLKELASQKIPSWGLYDQVELDDRRRDFWEAALHPWRDAVCVDSADLPRALEALEALPGSVLISPGPLAGTMACPEGIMAAPAPARPFLNALAGQSHWTRQPAHARVDGLGAHIIGSFPSPVVGRAALLGHLRSRQKDALAAQAETDRLLDRLARRTLLAEADLQRAEAGEALPRLQKKHDDTSTELTRLRQALPQLKILLDQAEEDWATAKNALNSRKSRIEDLGRQIDEATATLKRCEAEQSSQQTVIDQDAAHLAQEAFGQDPEAARALLNWPADWLPTDVTALVTEAPSPPTAAPGDPVRERRSATQLHTAATATVNGCMIVVDHQARTAGYPTVALDQASRITDSTHKAEVALQALGDWLTDTEVGDADVHTEVERVRKERIRENTFIADSVDTLADELRHTQDVIIQRVSGALDNIAKALEQLNREAGLFGTSLHYQIDPPTETEHSWQCFVTPRWRRNPGGHMLAYNTVTNTAQEKLFSIHLVLAALLAAPNAQGRILILDELGDSLGKEHRREVLAAITKVATTYGITVLGTCQDTLMREVTPVCGQILYFHYPSKSDYLNLPTRMFGHDPHRGRVELTAEQLTRRLLTH
ncbi:hypothetical protein [Streptomyces sp. NPDC018059]|uniref:hypothetical protein n=1 Tax=Streptomyces sp. NPDC018059 TaxID=3365041 RepID=UPI0037964F6C